MNKDKLIKIIEEYKQVFVSQQWEKEKYKWQAVKHFQESWDINADNFSEMFMEATNKTYNLLASMSKYPRRMIKAFADVDSEATRAMFINLFDESKNIFQRIEKFNSDAEAIRITYGEGKWNNHYQDLNSISTYLWLRYPDKYYLYKYSVYKDVVKELEANAKVKTGLSSESYFDFFDLYNEICAELQSDNDLKEMLNSVLREDCYKDPELKTMTIDFCYYLNNTYLVNLEEKRIKALISENPNLKRIADAEDIDPDSHDGSYELMRVTVELYSKVDPEHLGIEDLDLIYSMAIGTWKISVSNRKNRINKSNLPNIEKERLKTLLDKIMERLDNGEYSNVEGHIGMFGTGFMTFNKKSSPADAKKFILLLIEIKDLEDDNEILKIAEEYLKDDIAGIQAGAASSMLHCLKPRVFPIINGSVLKSIVVLEDIGVVLKNGAKLTHYIDNTRILKNFRDKYCKFNNYRVLDMQLWDVNEPNMPSIKNAQSDSLLGVREKNSLQAIKCFDPYSKEDFLSEVYIAEEEYDILISLLDKKKNIILQGAPGVGKTFASKRLAYAMMGEMNEDRIEFIQFHQNYSYEDFIMGYKPVRDSFELKYGVFYNFCKKAENTSDKPFFFFIDEINRGNMSKIFGELLMLIEKDYRNKKATLAYNGKSFSVPDNLYIIGMMNTADRSLAMIDYALRRRFSFYEMVPGFDSDGFRAYQRKLDDERFDTLIEKVKELNKDITSDSSLGKGFAIGHSYFCGAKVSSDEWLMQVVEYDILPMLSEYWFDEPGKLQGWENILRGVFDD